MSKYFSFCTLRAQLNQVEIGGDRKTRAQDFQMFLLLYNPEAKGKTKQQQEKGDQIKFKSSSMAKETSRVKKQPNQKMGRRPK